MICLILLTGCNFAAHENAPDSREITDMLGRRVQVPDTVENIVGVGPGALRLLVYMDLANRVSGVEDVELRPGRPYTFACKELTSKPLIGPYMGGDSELIAMNNPDVIFMAFSTASDADDLQRRTGLPVVALNSGNLRDARDTLYNAFDLIGELTRKQSRADSLKMFIEKQIDKLDSITTPVPSRDRPRAYIGAVSYRGAQGISSTGAFYAPFGFVNTINVAGTLKEEEPVNPTGTYVDIEQIIQWDPGYLFIDAAGVDLVNSEIDEKSPLAITLSAMKNGQVYIMMPHNWYATNFENVLANAWYAGKIMYPELFADINFEKEAREIYRFMLGKDVYDQMKEMYDGWEEIRF